MRERLNLFATDVLRYGPVVIITLATLVCLPSFGEFFWHRLALSSMLGRYCAALLLATIGVHLVSRVLISYALRNVTDAEQRALESRTGSQGDKT